jgi:alpha-L-fucosidase 2
VSLTPQLAAAAEVSLKARGNTGDVREWSYAWRTALFARLHDAADAHDQLMHFFGTTTLNLLGNHPPMQMDGNFGVSAAIGEMLLQSHEGEINLLPALPKEWASGSVKGLRARGGFEIDLKWNNGQLQTATVHSTASIACGLRYGSKTANLTLPLGQSIQLDSALSPLSH